MLRRARAGGWVAALAVLLWIAAGAGAQTPARITFLHVNDVYEIDGIEGGKFGGLARLASLRRQLERAAPPVLMTLGGDYLSPSAIGTAVVDGQPLAGRQMVDVMNEAGLDVAVLGNHEFDVSEAAFLARIAESRFRTVTTNVSDVNGELFPGTVRSLVVPMATAGRTVRIGIIGLTLDSTRRPWVMYSPPIAAATDEIARLRGKVDAIVALTHLPLTSDQELVSRVPAIDLVLGGHEHENWLLRRGEHFTPIVKADANARSAAVVTMTFGRAHERPSVSARFQVLDHLIAREQSVQRVVDRWTVAAFDALRKGGFDPVRVVASVPQPLDGRESTVRNQPGLLTDLITAGFAREAGEVDVAILNGGSVRVDDVIQPGPVTEYDLIRILPFGGNVMRASMDGSLLVSVLSTGQKNRGSGGFLHVLGAAHDGTRWTVRGEPLDPLRRYSVALTDFLLSGGETNLGFLTRGNPGIHDVKELRDVRLALIGELSRRYPRN